MPEKVQIRCIIEMLSTKKEYLQSTIQRYVEKLKKQDDILVTKDTVAEPVQKDNLFATHVELEAWFPSPEHLIAFCFDAMPSSIEILQPETLAFPQKELENLLNDLQARLHSVDFAMKKIKAENAVLDRNAMAVFKNFILSCIRQGKTTPEEIAAVMGVAQEHLAPFLDDLVKDKKLIKDNNTYRVWLKN